jgi:hypothetical protein
MGFILLKDYIHKYFKQAVHDGWFTEENIWTEERGNWGKVHNNRLSNLYSSNVPRVIISM